MEPWPAESTKRSRSAQAGAAGSNFRKRENSTVATSAMPIGMPGWPELACCTASIASARIALAMSRWLPGVTRLSCAEGDVATRSEEHTSELQSLMRISYAVFCLKKKNNPLKINEEQQNSNIANKHPNQK